MAIVGSIFNIVLFVSIIGSVFSVLSLLAKKVLRIALPLWFCVLGLALYVVPVIVPVLRLVPPEAQDWIEGYETACTIWLAGAALFAACFIIRSALARRALGKYRLCGDARIGEVYSGCAKAVGLKKAPPLYFGTMKSPACVVSSLRPAVILREDIAEKLSNEELSIVLCHELMHIKRGHYIYQGVFDLVSAVHWANPFVWIAKNDFAACCELDCDRSTLSLQNGSVSPAKYAKTMLRLLELSSDAQKHSSGSMDALGFLLARQRMLFIMSEPISKVRQILSNIVLCLFVAAVLLLSLYASRGHFYPYPAYDTAPEYSASCDVF